MSDSASRTLHQALDPTTLRRVFGAYPTGVTVVAALADGVPLGIAANSFTSVSLDPPLVSVCIARTSTTWPQLRCAARLGVSILSASQEAVCRQLAARPSATRFEGLAWRQTASGALLMNNASAWLECSEHTVVPAGDHEIAVLRVHDLDADHDLRPLVFHASAYRRLDW